jgi:hypothetical protein
VRRSARIGPDTRFILSQALRAEQALGQTVGITLIEGVALEIRQRLDEIPKRPLKICRRHAVSPHGQEPVRKRFSKNLVPKNAALQRFICKKIDKF